MISIICAAVNGLTATNTKKLATSISHTNKGRRIIFIPLQRMQIVVVTIFSAVPVLPMPLSRIDSVQ